ncbi:MAG: carbohydrate porin [Deltaproteobacteria bacterium]|nr:carbohydrate porin [Deltaproteobacteria bacterium]
MNKLGMSLMGGLLILLVAGATFGEESIVSREELDAMKSKLERLEKTVVQKAEPTSEKEDEIQWCEKIDIVVGATGILQSSSGAKERLSTEGDVTDGSLSFDLELTVPVVQYGKFYSHFEAGAGDGIDGDIPTLSGFNDDADDDQNIRLTEIWYEHIWFGERLRFRGGKVDLTTDFDASAVANSEIDQFLSSGFVNNLALEFPDENGFGAMLWASPNDWWSLGIGIADAEGGGDRVFEDLFSMVELDFKPEIGKRRGTYRLYGWFNDKDHEELQDPAETRRGNYGFGLSFDQEITEIMTLFTRYGWQRGSVSQVEHAWSAGLQCFGKFYGREDDTFGLGYGMAIIGDDWKDVDRANGITSGDEHHVELYYNMKVNDNLNISPDIQWVKDPNGDNGNDDVWVFGIRAQLYL